MCHMVTHLLSLRHAGHQRSVDDPQRRGALRPFALQVGDQAVPGAFDDVVGQPLIERQILGTRLDARSRLPEMLCDAGDVELVDGRLLFRRLLPPILRRGAQRFVFRIGRRRVAKNGRRRRASAFGKPRDVLQCVT